MVSVTWMSRYLVVTQMKFIKITYIYYACSYYKFK